MERPEDNKKEDENVVDPISKIALDKQSDLEKDKEKESNEKKESDNNKEDPNAKKPKTDDDPTDDKKKDDTVNRIESLQKELTDEKSKRDEDQAKTAVLEGKLQALQESLESGGVLDTKEKSIFKKVESKWNEYASEDTAKDYKERREMSKDDLDEFYVEDPVAATEWINKRDRRRDKDIDKQTESEEKPKEEQPTQKEFVSKQNESRAKLVEKYPSLNVAKEAQEIVQEILSEEEQGILNKENPSEDDIKQRSKIFQEKIQPKLREKNKDYNLMMEIIGENQDKYFNSINGPELVMAEMQKRLGSSGKNYYTAEEFEAAKQEAIETERIRIGSVDQSISSKGSSKAGGGNIKSDVQKKPTYKKGLELFLQASNKNNKGWTEEDYINVLERREGIKGADSLEEEDAKKSGVAKV